MAEPESVIAEGALVATRVIRELWARKTAGATERPLELQDVRRRLELFVAAVFPNVPEIGIAEPPAQPSLLGRLARRGTSHLYGHAALSSADDLRIRLPATLENLPASEVLGRYRLLALEQATRAWRGTPGLVTGKDLLHRDLYLLSEAAAVDSYLVRIFPRLRLAIREARVEANQSRPALRMHSPREMAVESLVRALLAGDPAAPPLPFVISATPHTSDRWAAEQLTPLRKLAGPYRGTAPVPLWGTTAAPSESPATTRPGSIDGAPSTGRSRTLPRRPRVRVADKDEDDAQPGTWMVRADDVQEKAEDPAGLQRPADRDQQADAGELADALSELPEARLVLSPNPVHEILAGEDPICRAPGSDETPDNAGIIYPEWDWRAGAYRSRGAIVRESVSESGDEAWADEFLRRQAPLVRRIRRDFERLRPRRATLRRQREGAELDIDAMVEAHANARGGGPEDDGCYIDARPVRRDVAIALLVDASASTDGWVSGTQRIIDVEKEALLVVCEALVALGDPHAILAFAGQGPGRVEIRIIKRFEDRAGNAVVRRRIAGLEPAGYTRAGAALRHAATGLMRQAARHRVMLLLSDGRPNDVDQYEGRYGVEDTRVAVAEARLQGVRCFCLTVDRQAPRYAARIFGRDYAVLSKAGRLPLVLTALLRDLIRS